jgi:rhodanese-related sulfurtransferase
MSFELPTISPAELQQILAVDAGISLLDVRTPEEFAEGHVPQARNEELDGLQPAELFSAGILPRDQPVYLICRTENRARKAALRFAEAGHPQVTIVAGGTLGWIAAGLPVATAPGQTPATNSLN